MSDKPIPQGYDPSWPWPDAFPTRLARDYGDMLDHHKQLEAIKRDLARDVASWRRKGWHPHAGGLHTNETAWTMHMVNKKLAAEIAADEQAK